MITTCIQADMGRLVRPSQPMSDAVRTAMVRRDLVEHYQRRPAYQRNDYLMWINKAKRDDTRQKRIDQMLDELEAGGVYMRMQWNGEPASDVSAGANCATTFASCADPAYIETARKSYGDKLSS